MKQLSLLLLTLLLCGLVACGDRAASPKKNAADSTANAQDSLDPQALLAGLAGQIAQNPNNYALLNKRSELYYRLDSVGAALRDIEASLKINDSVPETYYLKGFYSLNNADTATALKALSYALQLGTPDPEVSYQLAQVYIVQNKLTEAKKAIDLTLQLDSSSAQYIFSKGFINEKEKKYAAAVLLYEKAIKKDSTFDKAYLQLHHIYQGPLHSEVYATKWLDKLLIIRPNHPLGNFYKANDLLMPSLRKKNLVKKEDFNRSMRVVISFYNTALQFDPKLAQAYYERGYCYHEMDEHDAAMRDFEKTLTLNPKHAPAHFMIGSYYEHYKDKANALEHYKKALALSPNFKEAAIAIQELSKAD